MQYKFFDGSSSETQLVDISFGQKGIFVDKKTIWLYEDIRILENPQENYPGVITNVEFEDARLHINEPHFSDIKTKIPHGAIRLNNIRDFFKDNLMYIVLILICVFLFPYAIEILSKHIDNSESMESLGDEMVSLLVTDRNQCSNPQSIEALNGLMGKLSISDKYKIYITNDDMVNAISLPGGNIIIYSKLLKSLNHPEELSALIGHEVAHSKLGHIKQLYLSSKAMMILGGGDAAGLISFLAQSFFSREKEQESDLYSHDFLLKSSIDPKYLVSMLEILKDEHPLNETIEKITSYFSTHPATSERIKLIEDKISGKSYNFVPIIPSDDWKMIKNICEK